MLEQVECRVFTQFIFQYTKKTREAGSKLLLSSPPLLPQPLL